MKLILTASCDISPFILNGSRRAGRMMSFHRVVRRKNGSVLPGLFTFWVCFLAACGGGPGTSEAPDSSGRITGFSPSMLILRQDLAPISSPLKIHINAEQNGKIVQSTTAAADGSFFLYRQAPERDATMSSLRRNRCGSGISPLSRCRSSFNRSRWPRARSPRSAMASARSS